MFYKKVKREHTENEVVRVDAEDAYVYALECVLNSEEDKKEFIEWFYSGNWVKVENESETD